MPEYYQDQEPVQRVIRRIIRTERFGLLDEIRAAPEPDFSNELEKRLQQSQDWLARRDSENGLSLDLDAWNVRKILSLNQKIRRWPKNKAILIRSNNLDKALSAAFYLSDQKFTDLTILPQS